MRLPKLALLLMMCFAVAEGSPGKLSYLGLKDFIEAENLQNVDELLAQLKQDNVYKDFFLSPTFVYKSEGLHKADVDQNHPRTILFNGNLVMSFLGNPADPKSFNGIELLEFEESSGLFYPRQIQFETYPSGLKKVLFNDKPTSCRNCHGEHLRPIFGEYTVWPGVYFGDRGGTYPEFYSSLEENQAFYKFLDTITPSSRYALFELPTEDQIRKAGGTFLPKTDIEKKVDVLMAGAASLSDHLWNLNFKRIFKALKDSPAFEKYRYAIFGALLNCDSIESFLPPATVREHEKELLKKFPGIRVDPKKSVVEALIADTDQQSFNQFYDRQNLFKTLNPSTRHSVGRPRGDVNVIGGNFFSMGSVPHMGKLRFLLEADQFPSDVSIEEWSISRLPGETSYTIGHQFRITEFLDKQYAPYMATIDTEIAQSPLFAQSFRDPKGRSFSGFFFPSQKDQEKICSLSRKKSLEGF